MIRLGSLAGYPFEGPRVLAGWTPPASAAVYAIAYKPDPDTKPERYAVIYVGHSEDLSAERLPFNHPRAKCWVQRAGSRWKVYICTYEVPGGRPAPRADRPRAWRDLSPACNEQQYDKAWKDEWIGGYWRPPPARSPTADRTPGAGRPARFRSESVADPWSAPMAGPRPAARL